MDRREKEKLFVSSYLPPLALWAATKLLETQAVRTHTKRVESKLSKQEKRFNSAVKQAGKNIRSNPGWVAAGASAILLGLGLLARAARK